MGKERLDVILVRKGYFDSRERAKSEIMSGSVFVNNNKVDKPGTMFNEDCDINIKKNTNPYVSRGGLKLDKALNFFDIKLTGVVAMDVGASTGGFTDCMLKNGAQKVYTVDVGYGQLAWTLRNDSRVVNMERTNIRNVSFDDIGEYLDFVSIDVSFISLKKILHVVISLMKETGRIVCLIKPQFEAGREKVGKHGVVRDKAVHVEVITGITSFCIDSGLYLYGLTFSPVKGPEGNIEYLLYASKSSGDVHNEDITGSIEAVVDEAHSNLNG